MSAPGVELRHFRYFLAVYEELHFGRAAAQLHIAQPPLSQAVRKLEAHLGVRLFERTTRTVAPTAAGEVFAVEARKVLTAVEAAVAAARGTERDTRSLRIGCSPYVPIELLLEFLGALDVRLPDLRTEVTHGFTAEHIALLHTGSLDIALVPAAEEWDGIETEPLFPGRLLGAYVRPDDPLARKERLTPADVEGKTVVLVPRATNPALHERVVELLAEHGYRFAEVREAGGSSIRDFVLSVHGGVGVAVSFYSPKEVSEGGTTVVRVPFDPPLRGPELALAWRRDPAQPLRPVIDVVCDVAVALRRRGD